MEPTESPLDEFTLDDLGAAKARSPRDRVGTVVSGCKVERVLGAGAQGVVLAATRSDGLPVVLKFLSAEMAGKPQLRARFQREWEALRKIGSHPNVVRVYDVYAEGSEPHIVMERVEGTPLRAALKPHGRVTPADAARIGRDIARGLSAVHACGLIHRDVKPDNVLVTPGGVAKIVDFGLAKDVFMSTLTMPGQLLGTASYMAPEQWDDTIKEDARCDLFALGATLYHLLAGTAPFQGADIHEIADACLSGDYEPLRSVQPDVPPALDEVVVQLLMAELRYRYESAEAVAHDLERVLAGHPSSCPALIDARGTRLPLLPERRLTLGSGSAGPLALDDPTVAARHVQLRREASGFVVRALGGAPTSIGQQPLTQAYTLKDGDVLCLGAVRLTFSEPRRAQARGAPWLRATPTLISPGLAVGALVALGDPRSLLTLLERTTPDRWARAHAAHALESVAPTDRERVLAARDALERASAIGPGHLAALAGLDPASAPTDVAGWLTWWGRARLHWPTQIGAPAPTRALRLRPASGPPVDLSEHPLVLVGRDARCQLRLNDERVSRHHATVMRLHQRVVVSDAESSSGSLLNGARLGSAFFEAGDRLTLGGSELILEAAPPGALRELAGGLREIDALTFRSLVQLDHPSVAAALVEHLRDDGAWIEPLSRELFPAHDARTDAFARELRTRLELRRRDALARLPRLLGTDAGAQPQAWAQALAERRGTLPVQVGLPSV